MAFQPDQCWYLKRVPIHLEGPAYLLQNAKEVVSFGRRVTTNDKVCNGPNVSRNHLRFVRYFQHSFYKMLEYICHVKEWQPPGLADCEVECD